MFWRVVNDPFSVIVKIEKNGIQELRQATFKQESNASKKRARED